jgi:hypothetical protein
MPRHPRPAAARPGLLLELLEGRCLPSGYTVSLSASDRSGNQIPAIQAYDDPGRSAMSIFDTGSSAITFSYADQSRFTAAGDPIPIKVPGGAVADGIGGKVTGDVSQPGTILAGGFGHIIFSDSSTKGSTGTGTTSDFLRLIKNTIDGDDSGSGIVQVFVGTHDGSPHMPTLLGTPILYIDPAHPHGEAVLITLRGSEFDFSEEIPGLDLMLPSAQVVASGSTLPTTATTSAAIQIPLTLKGIDNHLNPGNQVTETPVPYQSSVGLTQGAARVSGQSFLLDTGAQVSLISTAIARTLGLDLDHPEFTGTVEGVGGSLEVPGYTIDDLDMPISAGGGLLHFTHAPVYVLDVDGADGILGMNLFNRAVAMLYDPINPAGASVTVTFNTGATSSDGSTAAGLTALAQLNSGFAAMIHGDQVPAVQLFSGRISGHVFLDFNQDGTMSGTEPGLPNQMVYIDANGNGRWDPGEVSTLTDSGGAFQFTNLAPGSYTVREAIPSGLASVSTSHGVATVPTENGTTTTVDFGVLPVQQDAVTAFIADLYGAVLDRSPDGAGFDGWSRYLQNGGSRAQVAAAVWESPEHRGIQVDGFYETLLHRPADPLGRDAFVRLMLNGSTEYDVERMIITSPEYRAAHTDDVSFLTGLYNDVLARPIQSGELAGWQTAIQNGTSRDDIARLILASLEHRMDGMESDYQSFLHRQPSPAEKNGWASYLAQSAPPPDLVAETFLASDEFFALARQLASS